MKDKQLPVLIDFDGVLKIGEKPAADAYQFLKYLSGNNVPSIILSNSTLRTGETIKSFLAEHNMDFGFECISTVDASLWYVRNNDLKVSLYCSEDIKNNFNDFIDDDNPDALLIGDIGENWNYETMNEIFRKVYAGADIIAMQKNKFWKPDNELCLDAGAFISAIEYATGKESILIGKPSPFYFQAALKKLGFEELSEFIMIGDDIETDINAAQKINGKGILVFTGKTKSPLPQNLKIKPYFEANNLTEVIIFFQENLFYPQRPGHPDQTKPQGN